MFKEILMKQFLLIILLAFSFQKTAVSGEQKSPILVQNPGSFQLASDHQELVNFKALVTDCVDSNQIKTAEVDSLRVMKIITHWIESSKTTPVIHCQDLISAYVSEVIVNR